MGLQTVKFYAFVGRHHNVMGANVVLHQRFSRATAYKYCQEMLGNVWTLSQAHTT